MNNDDYYGKHKNQKGQVLVEYIFLLALLTVMATVMHRGINTAVADLWLKIVNIIAYPTKVEFR